MVMPKQIHPKVVAEMLEQNQKVFLLDVREAWEYQFCHLPNATWIPLGELPSRIEEVTPEADATIVVYCHHGIRSLSGAAILEANGFPVAYSMAGGIEAWSRLIDPNVPRYQ